MTVLAFEGDSMRNMLKWGLCGAVVFAFVSSAGAEVREPKFGCDNDKILVSVGQQNTRIQMKKGPEQFRFSSAMSSGRPTQVTGQSEADTLHLWVRTDHWGHVTVTRQDGHVVLDELVYCQG
jgi:hypothetical protein